MAYINITSDYPNFDRIQSAFYSLRKKIEENSKDESKMGMAGWSAEERRVYNNVSFEMYDGGYTAILQAEDFKIIQSYNYMLGTYYTFHKGDISIMESYLV